MNIMRRPHFNPLIAISIAIYFLPVHAQNTEDPLELAFVQKIVAAINSEDKEARKKMMHPNVLDCSQPSTDSMDADVYTPKQVKIPSNYSWEISPMPAGGTGWFPDKFVYPVPPTHQLSIDFEITPTQSKGILLQLVRYQNKWYEVTGCPKPETVSEAKHAATTREKQEIRIRELVANISPQLKAELERELAEGRKVDAILRYRNANNEDLAIAKGVIEQLIRERAASSEK